MYTIIKTNNIYRFDEFEEDKTLVPFTNKNRDIVETCVLYDSRYKNNIKEMVSELNHNYNLESIKNIVKEINDINHTRASEIEVDQISERIINKYLTLEELKDDLSQHSKYETIFRLIADKISYINSSNKNSNRYNLSLATKIIFHLSQGLNSGAHNMFSKYDSKVAENLYRYLEAYDISQEYDKNSFVVKTRSINSIWKLYHKYNDMISLLRDKVSEYTNLSNITLEELDHIMWYTNK